jgi:type IV pilus assembly protein PilM
MPAQPPGVWGIDLGQCGLKAIRLQEIDGQIVATAFDYVEHPKILSQPDADPDQLTREALDKFLSRNSLRGDIVAISVPGQSGLARFVKLPPVEEKKIADIVRFEAKQQIPFNLEEVVWDYQKIGSGVVTDGFAMETEIGLFAMKRDMVSRYLQHFKDVGVDVHLVQMAPLALCNFVGYDLLAKDAGSGGEGGGRKNCVVALDIGADSSNLVITDGERIIWQRPIPLGGNHFTRALTKDLKLTFAKAEHLKRNATKSPDLKKILAALKPVLNDFVGEVQRSLGYFTNTHRDAHIEYMIGLGNAFRLPGLQKFLAEKLQLEVRKLNKMERINGDQVVTQQVFTENILTFAVAYGLALQGLKRARLLTNLLPGEIRVERLVKAKKPFAVAAAAALLLAGGGLALSYALEYRTYGDSRVVKARDSADGIVKRANDAKNAYDTAVKKAREEEEAVKTIVAGQFERDDWLELYKFINTAVPQPDATKPRIYPVPFEDGTAEYLTIPDIPTDLPGQRNYWTTAGRGGMSGKQAYEEYLRRQIEASRGKDDKGGEKADEAVPGLEDLIQFNIESVDSFFCDNLGTYWQAVKDSPRLRANRESMVRPQTDYAKAPEGTGWIIAVQGWTHHRDAETFIKNTLLENIARLGIRKLKTETPAEDAPAAGGNPPPAPAAPAAPGQPSAEKEELPNLGPVINHISHVVLYNYEPSSGGKGAAFQLIGRSAYEQMKGLALASGGGGGGKDAEGMPGMRGGAGAPMMPGGAGMPGMPGMPGAVGGGGDADAKTPTGPSRSSWAPLGSSAVAGGGMMGGGAGAPGMVPGMGPRGGKMPPMMPGAPGGKMPPMMPGAPGGGAMPPGGPRPPGSGAMPPGGPRLPGVGQPQNAPADNEAGPKRTEFIIFFIWKEPTPSDGLRGQAAPEGSTSSTGATGSGEVQTVNPNRPRRNPADKDKDKKEADKTTDTGKEEDKDKPKEAGKEEDKNKPKDTSKEADKDKAKDADKGKDKEKGG